MSDRELLELAAKAAGIEFGYWCSTNQAFWCGEYWNPLESDGDALRLAVKLEMSLHTPDKYDHTAVAQYVDLDNDDVKPIHVSEFDPADKNDPYAATRRAIVRAAAAIGEGK